MRKTIIRPVPQSRPVAEEGWLKLEDLARVEVTSEEPAHPVESALIPGTDSGWQAAEPGKQTIRLIFDDPQRITRIRLFFIEAAVERIQEFALRWSSDGGRSFHEIVRQQFNFSPGGATREEEDYHVALPGVTVLELALVPDKSGGEAPASLAKLRLA
jgi:hypothetical protein